jgi:hypothetical protein
MRWAKLDGRDEPRIEHPYLCAQLPVQELGTQNGEGWRCESGTYSRFQKTIRVLMGWHRTLTSHDQIVTARELSHGPNAENTLANRIWAISQGTVV